MGVLWRASGLLLVVVLGCMAAYGEDTENLAPDGAMLLRQVIAAMPQAQMTVQAELQVRGKGGRIDQSLYTDMVLDWKNEVPSARYTLRDAFGAPLEALTVVRPPRGDAEYYFYRGDPLSGAPLSNVYAQIQQTDISWIDLSLSFLWWANGKTVGGEKLKGRFCYIVDVPCPTPTPDRYGGVRLWIDPQVAVLLQAVAYDVNDRDIKRLQVKSFKKIKGVWMISDLDVQDLVTRHKTVMKVRAVELKDPEPAEDKEGETDAQEESPPAS